MNELTEFITKLNASDLLVLTFSADRTYCRFFQAGLYIDRMYVTDTVLITELQKLRGTGDEINAEGIASLKQMLLVV